MALSTSEQMRWRLLYESDSEKDVVAFVLPYFADGKTDELMLQTGINTPHCTHKHAEMHWSHDDLDLFLSMLNGMGRIIHNDIVINFSDPTVVTLIHIVASARFATETDLTDVVINPLPANHPMSAHIGDLVALHSHEGAKLAVLTQLLPEKAICVMLEPFVHPKLPTPVQLHDAVSVSKTALIPLEWRDFVHNTATVVH